MDCCISSAVCYFASFYLLLRLLCFIFGDADFPLLWASVFGSRPGSVLRGQVVWITGASSGIGEELAYQLAKCGSRLVLSARRQSELTRVKQACLDQSHLRDEDVLVLPLDLLDRPSHEEKTRTVLRHFGRIDVLINNGGRSQRSLFVETNLDVMGALMELNFLGTLSLTKQVLPHMTQRGTGSVVTVSSVVGLTGAPLSSGYSASKHALQGFFDSLRYELLAYPNILISIVSPGPVRSQIVQNAFREEVDKPQSTAHSEEHKMPTSRCVSLMLAGIANGLTDMWIAQQPFLAIYYVSRYTPSLATAVMNRLSRRRIENFKAGLDADSAYFSKPKTS
ncbi:dehydrogenase/reductase SDR family member 7 [Neosynchiropus ocellatus]